MHGCHHVYCCWKLFAVKDETKLLNHCPTTSIVLVSLQYAAAVSAKLTSVFGPVCCRRYTIASEPNQNHRP